MKEIEKQSLDPCDIVVILDDVYRVEPRIHGVPCASQCHLHDGDGCRGYCWRWDNADDIVFRHLLKVWQLSANAEVCVTPTWREWEQVQRDQHNKRQTEYRDRKKGGAEPNPRGPKPKGVVEQKGEGYRATIIIGGERHRFSGSSREEVEAWLEQMKGAKQ